MLCGADAQESRSIAGSLSVRDRSSGMAKKPDIAGTVDRESDPDKPARDPCGGASGIEEHQNMLSYILWLLSYFRSASEAAFTPMLKLQLFW